MTETPLPKLVSRYLRYCEWARASGYFALDWTEYKKLRTDPSRRY
jgi:hypothetical protein